MMSDAPDQPLIGLDPSLVEPLLPLAYQRLRAIAAGQRRRLPTDTLNTTALVSEAWLRLAESRAPAPAERQRFFALFAHVVRNVLIDHVRARRAGKRDGLHTTLGAAEELDLEQTDLLRLLAIDAAMGELEERSPRIAQVVEMRFFAGYSNAEIAEVLGVNEKTVRRDWLLAKALLARSLRE